MFSDNKSKFVSYVVITKLPGGGDRRAGYSGMKSERKGYYHPWISYNHFEDKDKKIPKGAKKISKKSDFINEHRCGNKQELTPESKVVEKIDEKTDGFHYYLIHDNGGRPFIVYFKYHNGYGGEGEAYIYRMESDKYYWDEREVEPWNYTKLVKHFDYEQIYIGESPLNGMTSFSGGHGERFDGNTILFHLKDDKYMYVGQEIYQFRMKDDFLRFCSPVGNNDVPYPFIIGNKYAYMMLDRGYIDKDKFDTYTDESTDLYMYYYGHSGTTGNMEEDLKPMIGFKMVEKRVW